MANDKDAERVESGDRAASKGSDSAVAEANEGKSELVEQQKAHIQYLKDGGRSGISGDFGKPDIVESEEMMDVVAEASRESPEVSAAFDSPIGGGGTGGAGADDPTAGGEGHGAADTDPVPRETDPVPPETEPAVAYDGQSASGEAFIGDTEDLAELILEKFEEADDEDTDPETARRRKAEAYELLESVKTEEELEALTEELEDEDTFSDIDFREETDADGKLVWKFEGDNVIYHHEPEEQLKQAEETDESDESDSGSKVLTSDEFDQLGEDVAKTLREMGVQRIAITDMGDTKRVKMRLAAEHEIETNNDIVTSVALDKEVEMDFSVGEDGTLQVKNVQGVSGKFLGSPIGVDVNSAEVTTNEKGKHVATVKAGPFDTEHEIDVPDNVHSRLFSVLESLK